MKKIFFSCKFFQKFLQKSAFLILTIVCSFFVVFSVQTVSANWMHQNVTDEEAKKTQTDGSKINSPSFMINVSQMDPIRGNNDQYKWGGGVSSFKDILKSISDLLLMFIPILAGVSGVIAGYFYIASYGDDGRVSNAKNIIKWNIIAIFVALLSAGIIQSIASFL